MFVAKVVLKNLKRMYKICILYFKHRFISHRFTLQGNVFHLAVGIIIGTAFTNVVHSLVEDILTPPFGLLLGGVDFRDLTVKMRNFVYTNQLPVVIRYGKFIQEILNLFIVAIVLFFIIKSMNKIQAIASRKRLEEANRIKIELSDEGKILLDIRNILIKTIELKDEITL